MQIKAITIFLGTAMLAACGSEPASDNAASDSAPAAAQSAAEAGAAAFMQCRACHMLKEGEGHSLGPNLHGVFGAVAGEAEGFTYSAAFQELQIVWDDAAMDAFLENPRTYIPGNKMAFAGISDPDRRSVLIKYMREETQ